MKKTSFPMVSILLCMIVLVTLLSGCIRPSLEWVEMRDGVKLATDVYVQKNQQPHGVLLVRTPYNKNLLRLNGINWAENGWPTVIQDMRGRFASQGNDTVFFTDYADGFDTANWIVDQPWSNDKIATFGGSALGICQYFMAGANPSALACQFIQVATPNMYKHAMYWGGEFRESLVVRWLEGQGSTDVLPDIWAHENFSLEFWTNVTLEDNWQDVHVPAIHIGGWYDIFTQGTIDGFMGYQYLGGSGAQGKSKLILGPWTHGGAKNVQQGELRYPENCKDTFSDALFWQMVNEYTMGINGTYDEWPAVYYYIMGDTSNSSAPGNEWRESDVWPPVFTETEWFFHDTGELTTIPPSSGDSLGFVYDPL
ncbi:MAG: CocE/NonD family hydrolase, partial [Candidatus Thermoplasmatota archaeon]|nr:CocE/NonD family hydrolase [Candidatus Thermoplasmatota archaeon]